jgi:DNA repair protein RAD57
MTDLLLILPQFPINQYGNLLHNLEKHQVTTSELLSLDVAEICKRAQLPLLDVKRLCAAVTNALHYDLGVTGEEGNEISILQRSSAELISQAGSISTLDEELDLALGGGIPTGYVTEITGESGVGKTQFLLSLLLSVQLPPPYGLGRPALYISTESGLPTQRLAQMLATNPRFSELEAVDNATRPSLGRISSTVTPDLESQEHIFNYQVPVQVERMKVGLIVLDSVAANYRAEFERGSSKNLGANMGARSNELTRLGYLLKELARKHNLAVVVANQVADRFSSPITTMRPQPQSSFAPPAPTQESPLASRSRDMFSMPVSETDPPSSVGHLIRSSRPDPYTPDDFGPPAHPALSLDHQQRWFTGWGDDPFASYSLKTPSLGLVWSTQIACRIALFKQPVYGKGRHVEDEEDQVGIPVLTSWRRWMKVAFAPHVGPSGQGLDGAVEFEVTTSGLRAVQNKKKKPKTASGE